MATDLFYGIWELIPELSLYEYGPLPAGCTYIIQPDGDGVMIRMSYIMESGTAAQVISFGGPADRISKSPSFITSLHF